ncbi:MAG TPA: CpsD/CapB family tyrosine-protein kinase [Sphingomicrobium sp.]|nr:CpsD/CapB family tyrosine-protein kinase [Sphingomicrobium sp.]
MMGRGARKKSALAADSDAAQFPGFTFSQDLVSLAWPDSLQAESFRALRSNVLAQHVKHGRRALAICAPAAGSGCSFIAANLAVTMAQAGVNTLLVDGNMRTPSIQDYIVPLEPLPGLADCLADDALPLSKAFAIVQSNLSVLYAGHVDAATFDQLGAPVFRQLMDQCLRDFDLTIIDTPPSNQFADSRRIASVMRYAMVVTCRQRSFVNDVQVLLDEIAADGGRVIGTYLNDY